MPVQPGAPAWIARALSAGFLLLLLALIGVLATAQRSHRAEAASALTRQVLQAIDRLDDAFTNMQAAARGYIVSPSAEFLRPYRIALADIGPAKTELRQLTRDDA